MPIRNETRCSLYYVVRNFAYFSDDAKKERSDCSDMEPSSKKRRLLDSDEDAKSLKSDNEAETNGGRVIISDDEEQLNVRTERPRSSRVIISDDED